jgi:hypothetical protein
MTVGEDDLAPERKELIWIPVLSVVVAGVIGLAWANHPALIFQAEAATNSLGGGAGFFAAGAGAQVDDPELKLRQDDVEYLNRIYRETTHEQAYCGVMQGDNTFRVWKADTINSSLTSVWYDTGNCPALFDASSEIRVHTQPSSLMMSATDKENHRENDLKYSCIQANPLDTSPGTRLASFRCYEEVGGEFEPRSVKVAR